MATRKVRKSSLLPKAKEQDGFYKTLLENVFDGTAVISFKGDIQYQSKAFLKILGYDKERKVNNLFSLIHPNDQKNFQNTLANLRKKREGYGATTIRQKHKDGSWRYIAIRLKNLSGDPGISGVVASFRDITEKHLLRLGLEESEKRYRSLIENSFDGITIIDFNGIVKYHSPTLLRILGYRATSGIGKSIYDLMHPDRRKAVMRAVKRMRKEKGKVFSGTVKFSHKENGWVDLEARAINLSDQPGINGILINYRDITESERIKAALLESEERNRNIAETAPETIFILDASSGKIIDCNANASKLFGYSRKELIGMKAIDLSPEQQPDGRNSLDAAREKLRSALRGEKPVVYEWYHVNSKGKLFPTETRLVRFPPYDKKYIRGTLNDITARKALDKKLEQQEKDYRHLASVSPVGIFRTDMKGRTIYVNEKWSEITGLSFQKAMGTGWQSSIHPADRKKSLRDWQEAFRNKKVSNAVYRFQTPKGKITWVYGQAVPDKDENGNVIGYVGSVTDITERVLTEEALAKSEKRNSVLLKAIPDMIFRLSKNGTFLDFKAASSFGPLVPPEVFLGKKIKEVLPPPVANLCMKNMLHALETNKLQTYNYSLPDLEAPEKLNYFEGRIVAYDKNEALALIRDVTLQKEAELSLIESEERWKSLVASAPQYIVTINKKNEVSFINKPSGLPPSELNGINVFDFVRLFSIDEKVVKQALQFARRGIHKPMEIVVQDEKKRDIWFNVISAPIKHNNKVEDLIVMALDITELKKAEQELREINVKLKALYQRLETIREEEKKNIAMEIHDELGQELTAMKLGMFWLQHYLDQHKMDDRLDVQQVEDKVKSLIDLSSQTISSARKLAHQLRPVVLDNLGLIPAIEWQVKTVNESGKVRCEFRHNMHNIELQDAFSVALFRIIQESLTNILRHSDAQKALVTIHVNGTELKLTVEDNGKGTAQQDIEHPDKFGIFGMRERVKTWNGKFDLKGTRGKGTVLTFSFPLKEIKKQ